MSSTGCEGGEVGSEGAVELSGDEAFEVADGVFFGFALGDAAVEVAAGSFAVAEPDDDDHVQCPVGVAVAGEVEPVTAGAPAGRGDWRGRAQVREGRLGAEPVDVLAGGFKISLDAPAVAGSLSWRAPVAVGVGGGCLSKSYVMVKLRLVEIVILG